MPASSPRCSARPAIPAIAGCRYPGPGAPSAIQRLPARRHHRARPHRPRRGHRARGARRPALGGPGLRCAGVAVRGPRARRRRCGAAGRDRGLRAQGEHRALAPAARAFASACCPTPSAVGRPRGRRGRRRAVAWPRRSCPARGTGRAGQRDHRRRPPAAGHLPRAPDRRAGRRGRDQPGSGSAITVPTTPSRTWTRATSR